MEIINGSIANGLSDVCNYLDIKDNKAVFLHSMANNDDSIDRKQINKGRMIYAEIFSFAGNNGPMFVSCYYNKKLIDYYDRYNIINKNNLIMVGMDKKTNYPYNSVSLNLKNKLIENKKIVERLRGYTIVPSFISNDDIDSCKIIDGSVIMDMNKQVLFSSKYYMREISSKYNISVPYGDKFRGLKELSNVLNKFKNKNITRAWIKLSSQISGAGNIYVEDINDYNNIYNNVYKVANKIYEDDYIINDIPLIIEEDLSYKQVINVGLEAVIGKDKVVILGSVGQQVKGAVYKGSYINDDTYKYSLIAEETAKDLFVAYLKEGYCGFITVDVIVTNDNKGYCIDPNPRFSAGTMLLKNIHTAEYYVGKRMFGVSFTNGVFALNENEVIDNIFRCIGNNLYKGEHSNYQGIIPALCNDVNQIGENIYYLKSVVIADSYDKVLSIYNEFKNNLINLKKEIK